MNKVIPVKLVMSPLEYIYSGYVDAGYRTDFYPDQVIVTLCKHVNIERNGVNDIYTDMAVLHCSDCGAFLGHEN